MFTGYTLKKDIFIREILKKSEFDELRLRFCTHHEEWEAAKGFRHMKSNTAYTIKYESQPKHDDIDFLWKGISENAKFKRGLEQDKPFAFFIRDKLDKIKGGCSGYIYYGCLYVDLLLSTALEN